MQQPSDHSYRTITIESNVPNEPNTSSAVYITQELSPNQSMDFVALPDLNRLQSENKERVLNSLKEKIKKQLSSIEQQICIEGVCFEEDRARTNQQHHADHATIKLSQLLKKLEMLKCNHHFTLAEPQKVIYLLDNLDDIYNQIVRFELEIMRLFTKIKIDALRHITEVKQSFETKYYDQIKSRLTQNFDYANTKYALAQIDKFKHIQYPNLDYPNFKVGNMKLRIANSNVNNKVIGIQAINGWIERLQALDKKDTKTVFNRSVTTFMNKSLCEQVLFSYYLKSEEYQVEEARRLKRVEVSQDTIPFAAIEKCLLGENTVVRLKIGQIGEHGGIFLGVTPLSILQKYGMDNLITHQGSYYLTNRGHILSSKCVLTPQSLPFNAKDEIWIRREKNSIIWKRKKQEKGEEEVRINLKIKEIQENFYVCVHLEDRGSIVQIIDSPNR